MKHRKYSYKHLDNIAAQYVRKFNPAMLVTPLDDFDVYAVVEKILGVDYDWQYLSQDQSILGLTAFKDGRLVVFDDLFADTTHAIYVKAGTIIIDRHLNEHGSDGRENFTVMHEVFHQLLHKDYFTAKQNNHDLCEHLTEPHYKDNGHRELKTESDWIEWQADTCASCFLMPQIAIRRAYTTMLTKAHDIRIDWLGEMAEQFHVSREAMTYRLKNLNIIKC